mmetsp:Transcript_31417/g.59761  ORF Transcript_31417/g.59761 Transcript_31417/m.59761 type:complete len:289 (+) Transcript_31417:68-934(+)
MLAMPTNPRGPRRNYRSITQSQFYQLSTNQIDRSKQKIANIYHCNTMAAKAAIQRQWNTFLNSDNAKIFTNRLAVASVAILASASATAAVAVAVAIVSHEDDDDDSTTQHHSRNERSIPASIKSLLSSSRAQQQQQQQQQRPIVQCEETKLLPYQRLSHNATENRGVAFGPWRSESSANARKLLVRRQTRQHGNERDVDMNEKYCIDFDTVLGEGAYGRVHPACTVETGENVALKKISKQYTNSASIRNETDALLRIYDNGGHPNISGLRDMYEDCRYRVQRSICYVY